jgi:hypothetical protein
MDSPRRTPYVGSRLFGHANHEKEFATRNGDAEIFDRDVASGAEWSYTGQSGTHFEPLAPLILLRSRKFPEPGCRFRGVRTPDR